MEKKVFQCLECNLKFQDENELSKHGKKQSHFMFKEDKIESEVAIEVIKPQVPLSKKENLVVQQSKPIGYKKRYRCFYCTEIFDDVFEFREHARLHKEDAIKKLKTEKDQSKNDNDQLIKEFNLTANGIKYRCVYCPEVFNTLNEFRDHAPKCKEKHLGEKSKNEAGNKNKSQEKPYKCDYCEKNYGIYYYFQEHVKFHEIALGISQPEPKRNFKPVQVVGVQHTKQKRRKFEKRYECKYCDVDFAKFINYKEHMKMHTESPTKMKADTRKEVEPTRAETSKSPKILEIVPVKLNESERIINLATLPKNGQTNSNANKLKSVSQNDMDSVPQTKKIKIDSIQDYKSVMQSKIDSGHSVGNSDWLIMQNDTFENGPNPESVSTADTSFVSGDIDSLTVIYQDSVAHIAENPENVLNSTPEIVIDANTDTFSDTILKIESVTSFQTNVGIQNEDSSSINISKSKIEETQLVDTKPTIALRPLAKLKSNEPNVFSNPISGQNLKVESDNLLLVPNSGVGNAQIIAKAMPKPSPRPLNPAKFTMDTLQLNSVGSTSSSHGIPMMTNQLPIMISKSTKNSMATIPTRSGASFPIINGPSICVNSAKPVLAQNVPKPGFDHINQILRTLQPDQPAFLSTTGQLQLSGSNLLHQTIRCSSKALQNVPKAPLDPVYNVLRTLQPVPKRYGPAAKIIRKSVSEPSNQAVSSENANSNLDFVNRQNTFEARTISGSSQFVTQATGNAIVQPISPSAQIFPEPSNMQTTPAMPQKNQISFETQSNSKNQGFQCDICTAFFVHQKTLNTHRKSHFSNNTYQENKKVMHFTIENSLNTPQVEKRPDTVPKDQRSVLPAFYCKLCQTPFFRLEDLDNHKKVHDQVKKLYDCPYCPQKFELFMDYKNHVASHAKPFKCNICPKDFVRNADLVSHLQSHDTEEILIDGTKNRYYKPFKCESCHKGFANLTSIKKHVLIHMEEKPFKCGFCHKQFAQEHHKTSHEKLHTKDNLFQCKICNQGFNAKQSKMRHEQKCMNTLDKFIEDNIDDAEKNPFLCKLCGAKFALKHLYDYHYIACWDKFQRSTEVSKESSHVITIDE